jgi:hypothetical protein
VASIENGIGVGAFLEEIRGLLKSGEFRPVPVPSLPYWCET